LLGGAPLEKDQLVPEALDVPGLGSATDRDELAVRADDVDIGADLARLVLVF
jgi:hypothetical protein